MADSRIIVSSVRELDRAVLTNASKKRLRQALQAAGWNAVGLFFSNGTWVGIYYCREKFEKSGTYDYVVQGILEGVISDAVSICFSIKAELVFGVSLKNAMTTAFRELPAYLPLDCAFQGTYDLIVAIAQKRSLIQFQFVEYNTPIFDFLEVALSFLTYTGGYSLFYYATNRWMGVDVSFYFAFMVGLQYFLFYLNDAVLDVELNPLAEGIRNLLISCFTMGAVGFVLESIPAIRTFYHEKNELAKQGHLGPPDQDLASQRNRLLLLSEPLLPRERVTQNPNRFWQDKKTSQTLIELSPPLQQFAMR